MDRAPLAMVITGFVVAIPVFFDVAFIILVPMIYALQRQTGKSLLAFGIPLLAGLAITHGFIPPTPGPVAVADIIGANLGWVIAMGFIVGIPSAIVAGLWFGRWDSPSRHGWGILVCARREKARSARGKSPEGFASTGVAFELRGRPPRICPTSRNLARRARLGFR